EGMTLCPADYTGQLQLDPQTHQLHRVPVYLFVENVPWIESFGIHYKVGVDGISLWMVLLTTLLTPIALSVSWNSVETKVKEFAFAFLLLEVGMLGAFLATDLFLFYVFWELMLV